MRITEVDAPVTQIQIDALERVLDKVFGQVGIDVEFTRHFLDRVNDERNIKQITIHELGLLFKKEFQAYAKPIAQLGPDAEAVLKDLATDINIPFALDWNKGSGMLELVAKTVMRKKNFKTSNREFEVEGLKSALRPGAYQMAAERLHRVLERKQKENNGVFRHALGWYVSKIADGFKNIDADELHAYYQKNFNPVMESTLTEEAALKLSPDQLRLRIPANDNTAPRNNVIDLDARRNAARTALAEMTPDQRKAANDFIKNNKSILRRLSQVGARSAARHGVATLSSAATGPLAPAAAIVLNVALLGWDVVDAGMEIWDWATNSKAPDIAQGNANAEWGTDLAIEVPTSPMNDEQVDGAYDLTHLKQQAEMGPEFQRADALQRYNDRLKEYKADQAEWDAEFGNTHLGNGVANPAAGYDDAILRIAQAEIQKTARDTRGSDSDFANDYTAKPETGPVINFTNIQPLEVPTFDPEIEVPSPSADPEIDIENPKRVTQPDVDEPFVEPELPITPTPTGPKIDTTSPEELPTPKIDITNPEVPAPTVEPSINPEVPARPVAPSKDEPYVAPASPTAPKVDPEAPDAPDAPSLPDKLPDLPGTRVPGVEFDPPARIDSPSIDTAPSINTGPDIGPAIATAPAFAPTPPAKTPKTKTRKKRDRGTSDQDEYLDPLQRWQKKYGMY